MFINKLLLLINKIQKNIYCVNIGANDGQSCLDPLYEMIIKYNWRAILVEPNLKMCALLQKNFTGKTNVIIENSVLNTKNGTCDFYMLHVSDALWATGLSSVYKEQILKHEAYIRLQAKECNVKLPNDINDWYTKYTLPCLTFKQLLKKHNVSAVQVVHIDAEGHDYEIVKLIDFNKPPLVIHYEYMHLTDDDRAACIALLISHNYVIYHEEGNIIAVHSSVLNNLQWWHFKNQWAVIKIKLLLKKSLVANLERSNF